MVATISHMTNAVSSVIALVVGAALAAFAIFSGTAALEPSVSKSISQPLINYDGT